MSVEIPSVITTGAPPPVDAYADEALAVEARSPSQQAWRRLKRDRLAIVGGVVIILMILVAFIGAPVASHLLGHGPNETSSCASSTAPAFRSRWASSRPPSA